MNKRETVLQLAQSGRPGDYTPAAFFLHFPAECHRGQPAIDKHIEYFRATGNDIVKVQYEAPLPRQPDLVRPADWAGIPGYDAEFFADQVAVVAGVAENLKAEAVVVVTLYSAYMFASHLVGWDQLDRHMEEDPGAVSKGLEIITESMLTLIEACVGAGADGFYVSSQGGEAGRFTDPSIFDTYIRPLEMRIWDELRSRDTVCNILHVCDYERPYDSLNRFTDYPGEIVSAPLTLSGASLTGAQVAQMFGRPFMGGLERLEALSTGPIEAVEAAARKALETGPAAMILGADCTLAAGSPWENIRRATDVAHSVHPA